MIGKKDYKILLVKSEEGYSVSCPGIKEEALENIKIAIKEYLEAKNSLGNSGSY